MKDIISKCQKGGGVKDIISKHQKGGEALSTVIEKFNVLSPSVLNKVSDDKLCPLSVYLKDQYKTDLSDSFPQQMISFQSITNGNLGAS